MGLPPALRPTSRAHCQLCSPDGDADTSAPNSPRPLLAEDQLQLRGSGATVAALLLLNHAPVLVGSGCGGSVPMTPATRASLGWGGPWPPRACGCQSQASTSPDALFRGRKGLLPPRQFRRRCQLWPGPRSDLGVLDPGRGSSGIRQMRGQGRQGVEPWEPAQSPPGQRRRPTPGRGAAGAPQREGRRPPHTEGWWCGAHSQIPSLQGLCLSLGAHSFQGKPWPQPRSPARARLPDQPPAASCDHTGSPPMCKQVHSRGRTAGKHPQH